MGKDQQPRRGTGSRLLGKELKLRRGHRSLAEMSRLSNAPPLSGRVEPVSGSLLHKIERGERMPSVETLRTLSMLYGMTVAHMFRLIESERLAGTTPEAEDWEELVDEADEAIALGDYSRAFAAAWEAQERSETRNQRVVARATKAGALWRLGMPREAGAEFQDLLADPDLTPEQQVSFYYHLAEIHRSLWNLSLAETFGRRGLDISGGAGDTAESAGLERLLGNILSDRAEIEPAKDRRGRLVREAVRHYEKAGESFESLGLDGEAAVTISNEGVAHLIDDNRLLAFKRLREGLRACREAEYRWGVAFTQKELGKAFSRVDQWDEARKSLLAAEQAAARSGYVEIQFQALVHLLEGARKAGDSYEPILRRTRALLPFLEDRFPERERFEQFLSELAAEGGMA